MSGVETFVLGCSSTALLASGATGTSYRGHRSVRRRRFCSRLRIDCPPGIRRHRNLSLRPPECPALILLLLPGTTGATGASSQGHRSHRSRHSYSPSRQAPASRSCFASTRRSAARFLGGSGFAVQAPPDQASSLFRFLWSGAMSLRLGVATAARAESPSCGKSPIPLLGTGFLAPDHVRLPTSAAAPSCLLPDEPARLPTLPLELTLAHAPNHLLSFSW